MSHSREGRKQKYKHTNEQELEAPQLSGTWVQGSLLWVALAALRLAWTCLFTNQVTGPHAFPRSACSLLLLKKSVLAHIYSCHKSVLLFPLQQSHQLTLCCPVELHARNLGFSFQPMLHCGLICSGDRDIFIAKPS